MTDTFEEDYYKEELVILESTVKAPFKKPRRNTSSGVDEIPMELFQDTSAESVKIPTRYGNNMENKMAYRTRTFNI